MLSMTGYGKSEYKSEEFDLTIEIRTVNNRYLDVALKAPKAFLPFEDQIRSVVKEKMTRGHMDLFVTYVDHRTGNTALDVDFDLAKAYIEAGKKLKEAFPEVNDDLSITYLLKNPDLLQVRQTEEEQANLLPALKETLSHALDALNEMREREGEKLKNDLLSRMDTIEGYVGSIKERAPLVAETYKKKMYERIKSYLGEVQPDENRLLTEVAVFTDKCNIDEEITRLYSHISQFREISKSRLVGRKLDFLVQEFNREANTICSKSNDLTVTECGLSLKNEIEKVREQVQNLE